MSSTPRNETKKPEPQVPGLGHTPMGRGGGGGGAGGPFGGLFSAAAKPKDARGTLRRFASFLRPHRLILGVVFVLIVASAGLALLASRMIGIAIDRYIVPGNLPGLARYVVLLGAVFLTSNGASFAHSYIMAGVSERVVKDLRERLFTHIQKLPIAYFDRHTRGEMMSRLANDVETVSQTLSTSATTVLSSTITIVGALGAMLFLSPIMTLVTLVLVPLATFISRRIAGYSRTLFRQRQQRLGQLNALVEESVTGHKVVQLYGQEPGILRRFTGVNSKLQEAAIGAEIWSGVVRPIMTMVSNLTFGALAVAGGLMVLQGRIAIGQVASFMQYSRQFGEPVNALANLFNTIQSAIAGLERVYEVLDESSEDEDSVDAAALDETSGDVSFRNVEFGYLPGRPVLKDISLHAPKGSTIAIVGPTGAGKTTLVNLLLRFYDADQGAVEIDSRDVRSIAKRSLRETVGIVLQDTYLFAESVKDNIRYGRIDATVGEIEAAAQMTGADEFIRRLPQGYDTVLAEEGGNLSQGQRQLLSITRAVLANPRILVLDEATSSVDTLTEVSIQKALSQMMKGRTSLVIAHRLSTIQNADKIIYIEDGRVAEQGTHRELLSLRGRYASLYYSQFHREEVVRKSI